MNTFKYTSGYPNNAVTNDSGLDIHCPEIICIPPKSISFKIDLGIKGAMYNEHGNPIGYMLLPRSSTGSKTPLRMSNSIGIIDSDYRGSLIACVDNLSDEPFTIVLQQRLFQLVCFNGKPIQAIRVDSLSETKRGEGGFGSTGV
jgi:dUTP pyrophosphatase